MTDFFEGGTFIIKRNKEMHLCSHKYFSHRIRACQSSIFEDEILRANLRTALPSWTLQIILLLHSTMWMLPDQRFFRWCSLFPAACRYFALNINGCDWEEVCWLTDLGSMLFTPFWRLWDHSCFLFLCEKTMLRNPEEQYIDGVSYTKIPENWSCCNLPGTSTCNDPEISLSWFHTPNGVLHDSDRWWECCIWISIHKGNVLLRKCVKHFQSLEIPASNEKILEKGWKCNIFQGVLSTYKTTLSISYRN